MAMARDRGIEVSARTNPEFARFAAEYDVCGEEAAGQAAALAEAETPERMAGIWLEAERKLAVCANRVTAGLFGPEE